MNHDLSLIHLFLNASFLVQLVMLLLLSASLFSWTLIFQRWKVFSSAEKKREQFEQSFWSGSDLTKLYQQLASEQTQQGSEPQSGNEAIFLAGFKEFRRLKKQQASSNAIMEGVERAMRVAFQREADYLEENISYLATVASVSPYVGLFGTVWGIMNSFRALGTVQQATLSMVAPGISEALIATAIGLFAAIPASIAYNRYSNRLQTLTNHYATFLEEFAGILHRQLYMPPSISSVTVPSAATKAMA